MISPLPKKKKNQILMKNSAKNVIDIRYKNISY